jgi:hypothetical protein
MRKTTYFDSAWREGWPTPEELKPYFFARPGQQWFSTGGNDSGGLTGEGAEGTEDLPQGAGRVDINLGMWGNPQLGVFLTYWKTGGGYQERYNSVWDLSRLGEHTRTLHDDPVPVGLFVPFEKAFEAVKEFIETDGERPKSIEWIANSDLPANAFPPP